MNKLPAQLLLAAITALPALAQNWTSTTGGNWSTGSNWSAAPANDGTADIVFNVNATQTSTVDAAYSINSLSFGTASGGTLTLGGTAGLTIGAGGIKLNMTNSGGATLSTPLVIGASQTWSTGDAVSYAVDRSVTVSGTITGAADKTITVSGTQDASRNRNFIVSANNAATFAGNWIVDAGGRLAVGSAATSSFGTGSITVNAGGKLGGTGGSSNITNGVTLAGGTLRTLGSGNGGGFSGNLAITSGSFVEIPYGTNNGNLTLANSNTATLTGSGNLTVNAVGTVGTVGNSLTIGNASGVAATNTGTLILNTGTKVILNKANNTAAWGGNVTVNDGGTLAYRTDVLRYNQVADTATVTINGAGTWAMSASTGNQMRERIGALVVNGSTPFTDGATLSRVFVGGSGTVLNGATGATGSDAAGTAGLFVVSGGSLSGAGGTVNKATTIQGGALFAGTDGTAGSLAFSQGLTFASGLSAGSLKFDLGATTTAGTTYDSITVDNLALGSGLVNFGSFAFTSLSGFGAGQYTLFSSANPITGSLGSGLTGTIGGLDAVLSISGNNLILTTTAIPEPSAFAALAGLGALGFVASRRRRRA